MSESVQRGHCLCRSVRFETRGNPLWVAYCHCESCRRHTGAPVSVYVGFRRTQVEFSPEEPPSFESSPGVRRRFCPSCGTPISYEADDREGELHLHVSGFEHPEDFSPDRHDFYSERLAWLDIDDNLPRKG
ncbi:MAG: GFA family protein [Gammaproteobacteria bacterium]|nr:MAG: GFA family protein [Gammaproteobacteria bacterium]